MSDPFLEFLPDNYIHIPGDPANNISVRQNNPGNLKFAKQKGATGAGTRGFAIFPTPEAGFAALQDQIEVDKGRGLTLAQFGHKYAPSFENDTNAWIQTVGRLTGTGADTPLSDILTFDLAKAVARQESGTVVRGTPDYFRKAEKVSAAVDPVKQFLENPGAAVDDPFEQFLGTADQKPSTPSMDATSDTLAQFSGPAGEMVGKAIDLPFVPLRKGLELFHQAVIEPERERSVQEWAEALKSGAMEGPGAGAPEAFGALPSKETFVPIMEMALAPAYLKLISRSIGLLGEVGATAFRRHAPDIFFKYTAKGGLPVPLSPGEMQERLMAMSGTERAEMARKYPQFRDVMAEMTGAGEGRRAGTPAPLGTPAPRGTQEGSVAPEKWQKEMETFATEPMAGKATGSEFEGAQNRLQELVEQAPLPEVKVFQEGGRYQEALAEIERLEGERQGAGTPAPQEWGEWGARVKKSGEPVDYQSQDSAEAAAKYISRSIRKSAAPGEVRERLQEARAVETEDGWTLETRKRAAAPAREFRPPEPKYEGEPAEWQGKPAPPDPYQEAIKQQQRIIERLDEKIGSLKTDKGKERWEGKKQEALAEIERLEGERQGAGGRGQGAVKKEPWEMTYTEVANALASNKIVPPEVLAEYPDLVKTKLYSGQPDTASRGQAATTPKTPLPPGVKEFQASRGIAGRVGAPEGLLTVPPKEWVGPEKPALSEAAFELQGKARPTSKLDQRLDALQDDYPTIDREKAAQVLRALPQAEDGQVANLAADPEMFAQVARGNLSASEKAQLLKRASDAAGQPGLPGMEGKEFDHLRGGEAAEGTLFTPDPVIGPDGEIMKFYSGGLDTAEVAKGLETKVWELMIDSKISPPGRFLKGRMASAAPKKFIQKGIGQNLQYFYLPKNVANKFPDVFGPSYEADCLRHDVIANHRAELWSQGRLQPFIKELSEPEGRRVMNTVLALDGIKSAEQRRSIDEKIVEQGPAYFEDKHKLTPAEAKALYGMWDTYQYIRVQTVERMKQDVLDLGRACGLDEARAREFATEVLEKDLGKNHEQLYYTIEKFIPDRGWGRTFDILRRQRENYDAWSREMSLYVYPHMRFGPYWTRVWAKGDPNAKPGTLEAQDRLVWAEAAESIGKWKKMDARIRMKFKGQDVKIVEDRENKIPMELHNNVDMAGLTAVMELARDQFEADAWLKFMEAKQAVIMAKGWGRHKLHRSGIPGFETENYKRVIVNYVEGWIAMEGKAAMARAFNEGWKGIKNKPGGQDEGLLKYKMNYERYLLDHPYEGSFVRRILYHLYLGGSMGFRLLHGLHALQTAWPEMSTISKQPGRVLARAITDRANLTAFEQGWSKDLKGWTAEDLVALEQGRRKAALSSDYTAEMLARSTSPMHRYLSYNPQGMPAKLKRGFDMIYYPTAADRFTREAIFLAAVRELRGKGPPTFKLLPGGKVREVRVGGPITQEIIDRAAEIVDNSMYRFTRGERPPFGRRMGATWMTFQTWSLKYFQQIFRYMRDGEYGALGRLVAAAGMVGGLNALGMRDVIQTAYRKVYGRDAESDSKHYLQTVLGNRGGEALNRLMFRGLPAAVMGFDLSPRMAHHLPWTFLAKGFSGAFLGNKENLWQFAGTALGPMESMGRSMRALQENAPGRAVEAMAPTWLRNPMAAHRLYTRGPETVSGRQIMGEDLKHHKMSLGEAAYKALGVQPVRLSEEQGKYETTRKLEETTQGKLRDLASRYMEARRKRDEGKSRRDNEGVAQGEEGMRQVLRELSEYNRSMTKAGRKADVIGVTQFRGAVQIRQRPVYPEKTKRKTVLRQ
jgi:hypothetical protein